MSRHLSVVIPCLNEAAIVAPALQSLQGLRQADHELILVDGGSSDGTPQAAAGLVDLLLQTPPGRARQMNAGAARAQGEILWFLHIDSSLRSGVWDDLVSAMAVSPRGWGRFDVYLSGRHPLLRVIERLMNLRSRLTGIATGDQGMFVRRDLFTAVGGFPQIDLMEDIALSRRLKRASRPLCLPGPLLTSSRRWEQQGVLRTLLLMWLLRLGYALRVDPARLARHYRSCSSPTPES